MIIGIGTDIVQISRIKRLYDEYGDRFINKFLSDSEIGRLPNSNIDQYLAGRFAVKEALIKATGRRDLKFNDIEIANNENGKPYIKSVDNIKRYINPGIEDINVHITISHEKEYAVAFVIIESDF